MNFLDALNQAAVQNSGLLQLAQWNSQASTRRAIEIQTAQIQRSQENERKEQQKHRESQQNILAEQRHANELQRQQLEVMEKQRAEHVRLRDAELEEKRRASEFRKLLAYANTLLTALD